MTKRISLATLKRRAVVSKDKTDAVRVEKRQRQQKKKMTNAQNNVPNLELEYSECGQTPDEVLNSRNVREWFREGIETRVSWSVTVPPLDKWWTGKQGALARRLLDAYDGELVRKAVFYFCENWEQMVDDSEGRLSGLPTVELLWSIRDRIFPAAEMNLPYVSLRKRNVAKARRDADEYFEPEDDAVGHGW